MPLPEHLFVSSTDGALYDTRVENWHQQRPLRAPYRCQFIRIRTPAELKATLRAGPYTWPGGYPLYFVMADGEALSFKAAREQLRELLTAFREGREYDQWRVVGLGTNHEDDNLYCAHTGEKIEAAYETR